MGGSRACRPRASTDFPVPRPPAITTPPRPGSTAASSRASFKVPWPVMAASGKARAAAAAALDAALAAAGVPLAPMERPGPRHVIASLADQPGGDGLVGPGSQAGSVAVPWATSLAIALGANLGDPFATLVAVRPLLQGLVARLLDERGPAGFPLGSQPSSQRIAIRLRWSPLFCTEPVGGPPGQPAYLNGVLLVQGVAALEPRPLELLEGLQALEAQFSRQRLEAWGPRTLDLDLLWWGDQRVNAACLELPHPRLQERSFVLAPLAAIDPLLVPPGPEAAGCPSPGSAPAPACATLLAALLPRLSEAAPQRLPGRAGWPE